MTAMMPTVSSLKIFWRETYILKTFAIESPKIATVF